MAYGTLPTFNGTTPTKTSTYNKMSVKLNNEDKKIYKNAVEIVKKRLLDLKYAVWEQEDVD